MQSDSEKLILIIMLHYSAMPTLTTTFKINGGANHMLIYRLNYFPLPFSLK